MTDETSIHYGRVRDFMVKAGQTVRDRPEMPEDPRERIRIVKLILEEALELARAMGVEIISDAGGQGAQCHRICDPRGINPSETELRFLSYQSETDLVEAADALADLSVVVTGGKVALGITDLPLQELIDLSNLEKFHPPICPACGSEMELKHINMRSGDLMWQCIQVPASHPLRSKEEGPYRREDGKWIRPPYWKKPNIKALLDRQEPLRATPTS